jgi:beta-glucosidase
MKNRTYRYMKEKPLFAFGHGLSYTTFQFGKAKLSSKKIKEGKEVTITIPVSNVGNINGEEVVQVYLRRPSDMEGPARTLRAFERVEVSAGSTRNIAITLNNESFEWFDPESESMRPLKGDYEILYGNSSDISSLKSINISYK